MSSVKSGLMSFLISGFGTGTMAGRAVGMTLAVFLFGFWLVWKIIVIIYRAIKGQSVPNFKEGTYSVQITSVATDAAGLQKELSQLKGYSKSLAKKVVNNTPSIAATGCDAEMADDLKTIIEHYGATCEIIAKK